MPTQRHQPPRKCKTGRVARDPPPTGRETKKLRPNLLRSRLAGSSGSGGGNQHLDGLAEQPPQAGSEFLADNTEQAGDRAVPLRLTQPENRHVGPSHPQPSAAATTKNSSSSPALEEPGVTAPRTVLVQCHANGRQVCVQITIQTGRDSSVPDTERDKADRNKLNHRQDIPSTSAATQIPTPVRQEQQPAPAAVPSTMRTGSANRRGASGSQLPHPGTTQPASSAMPQPNPQPAPNPSSPSMAPHPSGTGTISNLNICPV